MRITSMPAHLTIKQGVGANWILSIPLTTWSQLPQRRCFRDNFNRSVYAMQISLGLVDTQIQRDLPRASGGKLSDALHRCAPLRFSAMNASKSNGVETPLFSPSTSDAERPKAGLALFKKPEPGVNHFAGRSI